MAKGKETPTSKRSAQLAIDSPAWILAWKRETIPDFEKREKAAAELKNKLQKNLPVKEPECKLHTGQKEVCTDWNRLTAGQSCVLCGRKGKM